MVINILSKVEHSIFFDEDQYPTIASKAAYLWTKLAGYQTFQNGNKRTAMVSTLIFLHSNGYDFQYKDNMLQELVTVSTRLATKELSEDDLTNYILKNIKINYKNEEWNTLERLKSEKFK